MNRLGEFSADEANTKDITKGFIRILAFSAYATVCLFLPRKSWAWFEGWVFLAFFLAFLLSAFIPLARNPYLLKARLSSPYSSSQRTADKALFSVLSVLQLIWLLAVGSGPRFYLTWHPFDMALVALGAGLLTLSCLAIHFIVKHNPFLIPAVADQKDQFIVERGMYRWVRHPMYAIVIALSFGGSLLTRSEFGLLVSLLISCAFLLRLMLEEHYLLLRFPEYGAYMKRVRFRLLPPIL